MKFKFWPDLNVQYNSMDSDNISKANGEEINLNLNTDYKKSESSITHEGVYAQAYPAVTAADIEEGKVAYINGERIVGTGENTKKAVNEVLNGEGVINFNANSDGGLYLYNDGEGGEGSVAEGAYGSEYFDLSVGDSLGYIPSGTLFSKTGYVFDGWYTEKEYTLIYDENGQYVSTDHSGTNIEDDEYGGIEHVIAAEDFNAQNSDGEDIIIYYAHWKPAEDTTYTVIYQKENLSEGTYSTYETVTYTGTTGNKVTPTVKEYEGFTSPESQSVYISYDGSTTVTYKYTRNSYNVSFTVGSYRNKMSWQAVTGASITTSYSGDVSDTLSNSDKTKTLTLSVRYQDSVTLKCTTREGYGYSISGGDGIFSMPAQDTERGMSVTLKNYTISYASDNSECGIGNTPGPSTYTVETNTFTIKAATTAKSGYTFNYWNNNKSTTIQVPLGSTGNIACKAHITNNTYTIKLSYAEGLSGPASITVTYNRSFTLPTPNTSAGYAFSGWANKQTSPYNKTSDSSSTAKSSLLTYTIFGDGNGGANQSVSFNVKTAASLPNSYGRSDPNGSNYTTVTVFRSWSGTSSVSVGTTGNKTARATWNINKYHKHTGSNGTGCYTKKTTTTTSCPYSSDNNWDKHKSHYTVNTYNGKDGDRTTAIFKATCKSCGQSATKSVYGDTIALNSSEKLAVIKKISHNKVSTTKYELGCGLNAGQHVGTDIAN